MINQKVEGLEIFLKKLIPNSDIKSSIMSKVNFKSHYKIDLRKNFGLFEDINVWYFWLKLDKVNLCVMEIQRNHIALTNEEVNLIKEIPSIYEAFEDPHKEKEKITLTRRLSSRISFETIHIAQFLRQHKSKRFWTQASIILQLQELTYKSYEGNSCSSGFFYCNEPHIFEKYVNTTQYSLEKFTNVIEFDYSFFEKPASYRYIDGRNSLYLIDNRRRVYGILRLNNPNSFSIIDRVNNRHFSSLFGKMVPGKKWIAIVGYNKDVNIIYKKDCQLKWSCNHWQLRDERSFLNILIRKGIVSNFALQLVDVIFCLSELRLGSVLLIKFVDEPVPTIGKIDISKVGIELKGIVQNSKIGNLINTNGILGILSSDGLTTFSKNGDLLNCGDIIDIQTASQANIQGGGRTQAARAASLYGLAIKISEDGPITIFEKGNEIFRL